MVSCGWIDSGWDEDVKEKVLQGEPWVGFGGELSFMLLELFAVGALVLCRLDLVMGAGFAISLPGICEHLLVAFVPALLTGLWLSLQECFRLGV